MSCSLCRVVNVQCILIMPLWIIQTFVYLTQSIDYLRGLYLSMWSQSLVTLPLSPLTTWRCGTWMKFQSSLAIHKVYGCWSNYAYLIRIKNRNTLFRFLIPLLFRGWYNEFLFLYNYGSWDAISARFLFYQTIMFGYPFGGPFSFGLDCCCFQLYRSFSITAQGCE